MDVDNLPGNTQYTEKKEKKKLDPVITSKDIVKKDFMSKLKDTLFGDDILEDVVIPGIKNLALDGLEMAFFHDGRRRRNDRYDDNPSYRYDSHYRYGDDRYSYRDRNNRDSYYNGDSMDRRSDRRDDRIDFRNIVVHHRDDAERLVDEMRNRCKEYGAVSVADLLDLIDATGEYTDNNWGWKNPRDITLRRVASGFLIDVPEPRPLN